MIAELHANRPLRIRWGSDSFDISVTFSRQSGRGGGQLTRTCDSVTDVGWEAGPRLVLRLGPAGNDGRLRLGPS